jgi:hypothetical protein
LVLVTEPVPICFPDSGNPGRIPDPSKNRRDWKMRTTQEFVYQGRRIFTRQGQRFIEIFDPDRLGWSKPTSIRYDTSKVHVFSSWEVLESWRRRHHI